MWHTRCYDFWKFQKRHPSKRIAQKAIYYSFSQCIGMDSSGEQKGKVRTKKPREMESRSRRATDGNKSFQEEKSLSNRLIEIKRGV